MSISDPMSHWLGETMKTKQILKEVERACCSQCGWSPDEYVHFTETTGFPPTSPKFPATCEGCQASPVVVIKKDWFIEKDSSYELNL